MSFFWRGYGLAHSSFIYAKLGAVAKTDFYRLIEGDFHLPLLKVHNLSTRFGTSEHSTKAVEELSLDVSAGETLALVGESGCGKTALALSVMGLLPPRARTQGEVWFGQKNLLSLSEKQMCQIRGREIAMIFQEPASALNPLFSIGSQIAEALAIHQPQLSHKKRRELSLFVLEQVGFRSPEIQSRLYPHQLSGGMAQRVVIAIAISCKPKLLIADEPTSALDAPVASQILALIDRLRQQMDLAMILISHDLAVVAQRSSRLAIMRSGRIVEQGPTTQIFASPQHAYTKALLGCSLNLRNFPPRTRLPTIADDQSQ